MNLPDLTLSLAFSALQVNQLQKMQSLWEVIKSCSLYACCSPSNSVMYFLENSCDQTHWNLLLSGTIKNLTFVTRSVWKLSLASARYKCQCVQEAILQHHRTTANQLNKKIFILAWDIRHGHKWQNSGVVPNFINIPPKCEPTRKIFKA